MTISTTTSFDTYIGTDAEAAANEFPITWDRVDTTNDTDVRVILVDESASPPTEEVLVLTTDYTVDSSNNVVLEAARIAAFTVATDRLVILRNQTDIQPTDLLNNAAFQAETLETSLDRLTALIQQNSRDLDRALKGPETGPYLTTTFDYSFPAPVASQLLRIKSDLTGFELVSAEDIVSVGGTDHSTLSNLTSDDHLQYLNLTGRSGGQVIQGGSDVGSNLVLESNATASEGQIIVRDTTALVLEPSGVSNDTPLVLRFQEDSTNGSNFIGLQAPASVGTSVTFTLPATDGANGEVLQTNGSGVLSFVSVSPSDHGTLSGLGDDDHSQYLLLDGRVGGQEIFGGTDDGSALVLKATNSAVQGTVQVSESLAFELRPHGLLGADVTELRFYEAGNPEVNYVGFEAPAALAGDQIWVLPATDGSPNQALITDGAGNLSFGSITSTTLDINGLVAATPVSADEFVFADADDSFNNKKVTLTNLAAALTTEGVTDNNAIHDNVASEISAITEKVTPVAGDFILIEDSADSNNKKRVQIGNLPTTGGGEANTASNIGAGGVGVFDGKVGIDLQFRNINVGAKGGITVTDDVANDEIDIDLAIDGLTPTAIAATDELVFSDASDSNNNKAIAFSSFESTLTLDNLNGTLAISKGGTGQTTQTAAFDALSPTTTKGDIIVDDGTNAIRLAVGTDGQVLTANSATGSGLEWAAAAGGGGSGLTTIDNRTADFTISAVDGSTAYTNAGASGQVIATIPAATAGDNFWVYIKAAQNFRFETTGGDTITLSENSVSGVDKIVSNDVDARVWMVANDANTWDAYVEYGTWTQAFDEQGYFPGGIASGTSNTNESYDQNLNAWSTLSVVGVDMMSAHAVFGHQPSRKVNIAFGNAIIDGGFSDLHFEYDIAGGTWAAATPSPTPASINDTTTTSIGDKAYFNGSGFIENTTREYDFLTDSFSTLANSPKPHGDANSSGANDETDFYVYSGTNGGALTAEIFKYDASLNSWSTLSETVTTAGQHMAACEFDTTTIGVAGGGTGGVYQTAIDKHNISTNSVSVLTSTLTDDVFRAGGVKLSDQCHFVGGTDGTTQSNQNRRVDISLDSVVSRATKTTSTAGVGVAV